MSRSLACAALLLMPGLATATEISVGGRRLEIPNPSGYSPVTPQMTVVHELNKQFVGPMNQEFLAFIADEGTEAALSGKIPDMTRRYSVQTAGQIVDATVTNADFTMLRDTLKAQQEELLRKFDSTAPGLAKRINEGIRERYDLDLALSISGVVPLGIHEVTDRALSFSALVKYGMNDPTAGAVEFASIATTTIVHVKGKMLFLYCFAEEAGLDWCRISSKQWSDAVLRANPPDLRSSAAESLPSAVARIDWTTVLGRTLGGALIGGVVGLLGWLVNRHKAR